MIIDKNKISLRKANTNDIRILVEQRIIFLKEIQGIPSQELEYKLRQSLEKYFNVSIKNETFISWMAEYEQVPVGFSGMVIRKQAGNFRVPNGKTGYILNMYTAKEFRRLGIGTVLFEKLIEEARRKNLDKIDLHASKEGESLYRRFGFTEPVNKALEMTLGYPFKALNQIESEFNASLTYSF
jgi:ribosomal protein S18 acetylase RimI-like enzyme